MWLIDENLHTQLHMVLDKFGIKAQTVSHAGLSGLDNGALVEAAYKLGVRCILTQDRDFANDAKPALKQFSDLAVVIIRLPQTPATTYLDRFKMNWKKNEIKPHPGQVTEWP